ncbi:hypothetical protein SCH01S_49_00320 [Sphingomonas changbaiensis NBRC 104936]|uniref:Uncharacterized protein n=1 Tax=Sphingomonas changbaiensis NBRC 104936 TaxID=1219043 RepID=A0A0E9MT11_9SPHN|nr:hypothetical protein [Sphingomonas changbaiensis]GAO40618.1 hypothetical protein SCH01S_49_00320 [Sphingomonas changbaiensis NBRC 104936]
MIRMFVLPALWLSLSAVGAPAEATLTNCQNLYVIRIDVSSSSASQGIVFAETPTATSGSFYTYLNTTLSDRAYQQISAMVITAKATGQTIRIVTSAPGGCSIMSDSYFINELEIEPSH